MTLGFILLRHVKDQNTERYWKLSYERIRQFYPSEKIVIIDDSSDYKFIDVHFQKNLHNVTIIRSMWAGRGELLPYVYYHWYKWFDTAVILHDSVFLNKHIDFDNVLLNDQGFLFLWEFKLKQDSTFMKHHVNEVALLTQSATTNIDEVLRFHQDKDTWKGCFGAMSIVTHRFLSKVNRLYKFEQFLNAISNRYDRMSFERIIACLFEYTRIHYKLPTPEKISLLGNIFSYCKWGLAFDAAIENKTLPIIKAWTGR